MSSVNSELEVRKNKLNSNALQLVDIPQSSNLVATCPFSSLLAIITWYFLIHQFKPHVVHQEIQHCLQYIHIWIVPKPLLRCFGLFTLV